MAFLKSIMTSSIHRILHETAVEKTNHKTIGVYKILLYKLNGSHGFNTLQNKVSPIAYEHKAHPPKGNFLPTSYQCNQN